MHTYIILFILEQLFQANINPSEVKDIDFPIPVFTRLLRVVPKSSHDKPAMRMEVLGYKTSKYNFIE